VVTLASAIQTRHCPKSTCACCPGSLSKHVVAWVCCAAPRSGRTNRSTYCAEPV